MMERDKRMDSMVLGMDQKFEKSSMMINKEKNSMEEERIGKDCMPLLPTPPIHQRLNVVAEEKVKSCEFLGENSSYNLPKIELNMFNGENPREWTRKCNKYFLLTNILVLSKLFTQLACCQTKSNFGLLVVYIWKITQFVDRPCTSATFN